MPAPTSHIAERQRGRGQPFGPAVGGQAVQEDVRRGVVRLARRARTRPPAEENSTNADRSRSRVSSCRCHAASALGGSTWSSRSGVSAVEQAVVADAGRVDHHGQGVFGGDAGQQRGERVAVRHVARGHVDLGTRLGQLGGELRRARGRSAAAAREHEVAGAPLDQVPGDRRAQPAGAAGDQYGALGGHGELRLGGRQAGEPGHERVAVTHRRLRLGRAEDVRQGGPGGVVAVPVDQAEPARVLRLRGPHQAPDRRLDDVHVRAVFGGHRVTGQHHEPRLREAILGQPPLQ